MSMGRASMPFPSGSTGLRKTTSQPSVSASSRPRAMVRAASTWWPSARILADRVSMNRSSVSMRRMRAMAFSVPVGR